MSSVMCAARYLCVAWRVVAGRAIIQILAITKRCFEVDGYVQRWKVRVAVTVFFLAQVWVPQP